MALKVYDNSQGSPVELSISDAFTSPLTTCHDGRRGDFKVISLSLRNTESQIWYSNIKIKGFDKTDQQDHHKDTIFDETGWGVKLKVGTLEPSTAEWDAISWSNEISMNNIGSDIAGNISDYFPFWMLINCPLNIPADIKENISLYVSYTENAIA